MQRLGWKEIKKDSSILIIYLLYFVEQGLSACSVLKSVQATKNLYPFFSVIWQTNSQWRIRTV